MKRQSHKLYLMASLVITTFALLVVVGFNLLVDPYGLFEIVRSHGFNETKPSANSRSSIVKPYQLTRYRPKTLIAGNSRPELGIDPTSHCLSESDKPVFNAGVPGSSLTDQARMIQASVVHLGTKKVLWGIDFLDFLGRPNRQVTKWPYGPIPIDRRLPGDKTDDSRSLSYQRFIDSRDATLSLQSTIDSLSTLAGQGQKLSSTRRSDGFNPGFDYQDIVNREGQEVLFRQKTAEVAKRLARNNTVLFPTDQKWSRSFESVKHVLTLSTVHSIELTLFINPYHSDYLATIALSEKWREFEEWKQTLVSLASKYERVSVFDFSNFDSYSEEPLNKSNVKGKALRWFWEPAHYRPELGELMLARMQSTNCEPKMEFGALLSPETLPVHLKNQRELKDAFAQKYQDRWSKLNRLIQGFRNPNDS